MVNIASMIDHTLLKADATEEMIERLCEEAIEYGFKAVCVSPYYVEMAKEFLNGSQVQIATVIGFPLGFNTKELKVYEALRAIENGADEIDMVINIGALKDKRYELVVDEVKAIVDGVKSVTIVKSIIETCLLNDAEKIEISKLLLDSGIDFIKTSTGFSSEGATESDVKLIKSIVGDRIGIKAAGGIRDYRSAMAMIEAGASRIGSSASVDIIRLSHSIH